MNSLTIPISRCAKIGWYESFNRHRSLCNKINNKNDLILIGDSIIANFNQFDDVFNRYFKGHNTLNLGVGGDKIQNVLWRVSNLDFPPSLRYIVIQAGTNNLLHNSPLSIADGLVNIAMVIKSKYENVKIIISSLLPRDEKPTEKRSHVYIVNDYLKKECYNNNIGFIDLEPGWTNGNFLDMNLFKRDHLHLTKNGYIKLAKLFIKEISNQKSH